MAIKLIHERHTSRQVSELLSVTAGTVRRWLQDYQRDGIEGLNDRPRSGRPPKSNRAYHEILESILAETPYDMGFEDASGWTVSLLREWMENETGITLSDRRMRALLHRLGYRYEEVPSLLNQMMPPFPRDLQDVRAWFAMQETLRQRLPVSQTQSSKTWVKVGEECDA